DPNVNDIAPAPLGVSGMNEFEKPLTFSGDIRGGGGSAKCGMPGAATFGDVHDAAFQEEATMTCEVARFQQGGACLFQRWGSVLPAEVKFNAGGINEGQTRRVDPCCTGSLLEL